MSIFIFFSFELSRKETFNALLVTYWNRVFIAGLTFTFLFLHLAAFVYFVNALQIFKRKNG